MVWGITRAAFVVTIDTGSTSSLGFTLQLYLVTVLDYRGIGSEVHCIHGILTVENRKQSENIDGPYTAAVAARSTRALFLCVAWGFLCFKDFVFLYLLVCGPNVTYLLRA